MTIKAGMMLIVLAGVAALSASTSQAASVNFGLKSSAAFPGKDVAFAYSSKKVTKKQTIKLQRTFGTAAKFRTVGKLPPTKGKFRAVTVKAPTSLGKYRYRVIVTSRNGKVKAKSKVRKLLVFDVVSLSRLLGRASSRTVQVGGQLFRYVWSEELGGRDERVLKLNRTSCRALVLDAATTDPYGPSTSWLNLVQETGDPANINFTSNTVKRINLPLSGGAFVLRYGSSSDGYPIGYLNGFGLCFTANGRLSSRN